MNDATAAVVHYACGRIKGECIQYENERLKDTTGSETHYWLLSRLSAPSHHERKRKK